MSEVLTTCLILTGCTHINNMSNPDLETETGSVRVMIQQEPSTRSGINPQTQVGSSSTIPVSNGYLYFTDSKGIIVLYRKIDRNIQYSEGNVVSLNELQSTGAVIEETPENAAYCYVFLNIPASFSDTQMSKKSVNISYIEELAVSTANLYDAVNGGTGKVPLKGRGSIVRMQNSTYVSEVNVNMGVIASRIEISKLTTTASINRLSADNRPYEIKSFVVSGIFINNFFATSQLSGLANSNTLIYNNVKEVFLGHEDSQTTPYINYTELYTYSNSVSGIAHNNAASPNVFMPPQLTGKDVWAYNVFPNDTNNVKTSLYVPHIVVRFSQLTYYPTGNETQETTLFDQFITIQGFMLNGSEVQFLRKGLVYRLADMSFSLDMVSDQPEANGMNVKAKVSVVPWLIEEINPVL